MFMNRNGLLPRSVTFRDPPYHLCVGKGSMNFLKAPRYLRFQINSTWTFEFYGRAITDYASLGFMPTETAQGRGLAQPPRIPPGGVLASFPYIPTSSWALARWMWGWFWPSSPFKKQPSRRTPPAR